MNGINMDVENMVTLLREKVCTVKFKKVNGDERLMECTLNMDFIPENHQPTTAATTHSNEVVRVYEPKSEGWRSFRGDSVISFE